MQFNFKDSLTITDAMAERFGLDAGVRKFDLRMRDADSGMAFMLSQLAHLEAKAYEVPYAKIVYKELVPRSR